MNEQDTQINQIYLADPKNANASQILYEESLSDANYFFFVGELSNLTKKTEKEDLRKIADVILSNFKTIKKSGTEELFESVLSRINQELGDLAAKGKKSWLGKFSGLIALVSGSTILLANTGATSAYMKRRSELLEILPGEKPGLHPLKTFSNFTTGKLKVNDQIILASSNIFNFLAIQNVGKILEENDQDAAVLQLMNILRDSVTEHNSFCGFIFKFGQNPPKQNATSLQPIIYSPEPEEIEYAPLEPTKKPWIAWKIPSIPFRLPQISLKKLPKLPFPRVEWFSKLSIARKFFLISFAFFLLILAINVGAFLLKQNSKKTEAAISETSVRLATLMNDAESAFLYQNDESAFKILAQANIAYEELKKLDDQKAKEVSVILTQLSNKINRKAVIENPTVFMDLKANPTNIVKMGSSFIFAGSSANSIFTLNQGELKNVFLLNKPDGDISGITHLSGYGNVISSKNKLYLLNETQKQLDNVQTLSNGDLFRLKVLPGRLYAIEKTGKQIVRFAFSAGQISGPTAATRSPIEIENLQDLGLDSDIYLLYSDKVQRFSNGSPTNFRLVDLSESLSAATRINVGSSIYVLEPEKKRLILYNKNGSLLNQIYFPNATNLTDFYVDETARNIYLIDANRLLKITF